MIHLERLFKSIGGQRTVTHDATGVVCQHIDVFILT